MKSIVVCEKLVQYDMDARPIYPLHELPQLGITKIQADHDLTQLTFNAAKTFIQEQLIQPCYEQERQQLGLTHPHIYLGTTTTGDQFVDSQQKIDTIAADIPGVLCVEMEGAAIAQVCYEFSIPFAIFLIISDNADHSAQQHFMRFLNGIAKDYSKEIMKNILVSLNGV
ncbi:MAG: hypothetical protein KIT27_07570 [Legionellales bacterium]|nr:hypothetical protein [Legionellales bacterium]